MMASKYWCQKSVSVFHIRENSLDFVDFRHPCVRLKSEAGNSGKLPILHRQQDTEGGRQQAVRDRIFCHFVVSSVLAADGEIYFHY